MGLLQGLTHGSYALFAYAHIAQKGLWTDTNLAPLFLYGPFYLL